MKQRIKNILNSIVLLFLLIGMIFPVNAISYEDDTFGVVDINVRKATFFDKIGLFAIRINPTIPSPGQYFTVDVFDLAVEYTPYGTGVSKVQFKKDSGLISEHDISADIYDICPYGACSLVVTVGFTAPSTPGTYNILIYVNEKTTGKTLTEETKSFSIASSPSTCPASSESGWDFIGKTTDGHGDQEQNQYYTYTGAPPNCVQNTVTSFRTVCDSGYVISGTQDTVANGLKTCSPLQSLPQICTPYEQISAICSGSDLLSTISCNSDGTSTITELISCGGAGGLICSNNQCEESPIVEPGEGTCGLVPKGLGCTLPAESTIFGKTITEVQWAYEAGCSTGICLNTIVGQGGTCETPICCQNGDNFNVLKEGEICSNIVELSECEILEENICVLSGVGGGDGLATDTDEQDIELHKGINPEDVSSSTTEDLIASSCTKTEQCESGSDCRPLSWYINEGFLTEEDAEGNVDKVRLTILGTGAGAVLGTTGGLLACTALSAVTAGIAAPLCFGALGVGLITGAVAGSYITDLAEAINNKDINKFGYCTLEETEKNFLEDELFKVGDYSVTGLTALLIGFAILIFVSVLPKRT